MNNQKNSHHLEERCNNLNSRPKKIDGPVIYVMERDQRTNDNYALLEAQRWALDEKLPLLVVFCKPKHAVNIDPRIYSFAEQGLGFVAAELEKLNIPFLHLKNDVTQGVLDLVKKTKASRIYTDYSPLRISRGWKSTLSERLDIPFVEVDAHNIIPIWKNSNKKEFSARTIRPKIELLLGEYLVPIPKIVSHPHNKDYVGLTQKIKMRQNINNSFFVGGSDAASSVLARFLSTNIDKYSALKNDPNSTVLSGLSPYINHGHISAQSIALSLKKIPENKSVSSFLEELIIRRELAENFCHHCPNYDSFESFPAWAKETLNRHLGDKRSYVYSRDDFELAKTHDALWNAAQSEMVTTGKMHGYMRMYWAKKILEWTRTPQDALAFAIYLNDKYELDGRDPNGYTGIAWSIGGLHDRPWFDREVFGLVRYMNSSGASKKFDVNRYISLWRNK